MELQSKALANREGLSAKKHLGAWAGLCLNSMILLITLSVICTLGVAPSQSKASYKTADGAIVQTGYSVAAATSNGTITVTADSAYLRYYKWKGATRTLKLERSMQWNRTRELIGGSYDDIWKLHDNTTHGWATEAPMRFKSEVAAVRWLRKRRQPQLSYRNDGLAVGWLTNARHELMVEVWQVLIKEKKPTRLAGSQDSRIIVTQSHVSEPPIVVAVEQKHGLGLMSLLDGRADPNAETFNGTPALMIAVKNFDVESIALLLSRGANPNGGDAEGKTPLLAAIAKNQLGIVRMLVENGSDVNLAYEANGLAGTTPLMLAAMGSKTAISALLIDKGADVRAIDDSGGETALHNAASWGKPDLGILLLKHGAAIDERDEYGKTPLMDAILGNNTAMVKFFIDHGANVKARSDIGRLKYGASAFMGADKKSLMKLQRDGKLENLHEDGPTVLQQARMYGANALIIRMLKHAGAR